MTFRTTIELGGKTATGFQVPPDVVAALGPGKRHAVTVTINGHSYASSVASRGGVFMVPLSAENRGLAGVAAGDEVDVDLQLDTSTREVEVPDDLAQALAAAPGTRAAFDALSYSNQRRYTLSIADAKTPETRQRRIEKAVTELG